MDDERMDGGSQPLWPPDPEPQAPPDPGAILAPAGPATEPAFSPAPSDPGLSDAPTARIPVAPPPLASAPLSEAETARMPVAPQIPAHRLSAPPAALTAAPTARYTAEPPIAHTPGAPGAAPAARARATLRWMRARWLPLTVVLVILLIAGGALGVYNYAASLAAQPGKLVAKYCAALTSDNYQAAYALESASFQAQTTLKQYLADAADRDAISGRITVCKAASAQHLSALSFLKNPRSLVYNLSLTRGGVVEQGHLALSRSTTGWEVAALSSSVVGIDLGPLHTEEALCQAFVSRDYSAAYGLLSTPYQHEQGSEQTFTGDFGADLKITSCAPTLTGYTVDKADQRASFHVTLHVSLSGATGVTTLTLPATVTLVREADGWRVDTITPVLSQ